MPIKPKKEVIKNIKYRTRVIYGKEREIWEVYFGTDGAGKKIRVSKSTKEEALLCIDEFYRKLKEAGDSVTVLKPAQVYDAQTAFELLDNAKVNLTLTEAVRKLLSHLPRSVALSQVTLGDAYREYFDSVPDIQNHHKNAIKLRVGRWIKSFGESKLCSAATAKDIAAHLAITGRNSDKTYNNHLGYLKTFFEWCTKKERMYIATNPLEDMPARKIAYKEPAYMPVEDVRKMFRLFEKKGDRNALTILVLSFFCGIRSDEVNRIMEDPKQVNVEDRTIRIAMPKGWTQGMAPRAMEIPENALAWIKAYDLTATFGTFNAQSTRIDTFAKVRRNGIKIPRNAGRHSFITYHVAAYREPQKTEAITGTSKEMRANHYMGLASKRDGEAYFAIMPKVK